MTKQTKIEINQEIFRNFDIYEGKKVSLEKIGTKKEKELFQNGEFEKIIELINTKFKTRKNYLKQKLKDTNLN